MSLLSLCWVCHELKNWKFFECWMKDGSRSTSIGEQTLVLNHLKVLCSKGMVLNVQAKGSVRQGQVSVKKLNFTEPLMKCRKGSLLSKPEVSNSHWDNCNGHLRSGYRATGIKAAGSLHRLLFETWEAACWCAKSFAGGFFLRRLWIRRETVQTATQPRPSWGKQQVVSDKAIVVMKPL